VSYTKAQNLIMNGSFETYTAPLNCPLADFTPVNNWYGLGSVDYYSTLCSSGGALPNNSIGKTSPKEGFAVGGGYMYIVSTDVKEYFSQQLQQPLKKDFIYCMQYYVTRADHCDWATSNIDAWFSINPPQLSGGFYIDTIPQIKNYSGIITDTTNWVLIADTFIAKGGEQYVTIGNFNISRPSQNIYIGGSPPLYNNRAYYYIDSVSLYVCDSIKKANIDTIKPVITIEIPNVFTPNGDGINDTFNFSIVGASDVSFMIYNRWGNIIKNSTLSTNTHILWDGHTTSGEACSEGIYFYTLQYTDAKGDTHKKNGYVSLFR
jgi:gliding motility-associated-like protein